jgi:Iap family predicted aminopeptidase
VTTTPSVNSPPVDPANLARLIESISAIGSHPLGFRVAGTPEDAQTADLVAAEMEAIGLQDVGVETVPVDAWRFRGASVTLDDGREIEAASLGGVPPTAEAGITADVVFVGDGRLRRLDRVDVAGRIALVDWRSPTVRIAATGLELGLRGAVAIIAGCLDGGPRYQGDGALGGGLAAWHDQAPPLVTLRKEAAEELSGRCRSGPLRARVKLDVDIERGASGCNVIGVLPGRRPGPPIVVGAHHDGWFRGAFDNASGVASMLGIARALVEMGWRGRGPVIFTSHTAEEYGHLDDDFPWCAGAWHQVAVAHRRWGGEVAFYLNVEASGHRDLPLRVEGPPELRRFANRIFQPAARAGRLGQGWIYGPPVTGTEAWQFQLRGVPSLSVYNWHRRFARSDYHTTNDVPAMVDAGLLADLTRLYTDTLIAAESAGDRLLDHTARARHLARAANALVDGASLTRAAAAHDRAGSRAAFVRLARWGLAVDAAGETGYLHVQATTDARNLETALRCLAAGDRAGAARAASKVGDNHLVDHLSPSARRIARARHRPRAGSWAAASHLTQSPDLTAAIRSLRGDPGARPFGPWVERSLRDSHARQERESLRRLDRLADALSPHRERQPASGRSHS